METWSRGYDDGVGDTARDHLDEMIARHTRTAQMLEHLAAVIENGKSRDSKTYRGDALEALVHAKGVVLDHRTNLEDVRAIYDAKVGGMPQ